MGEYRPLSTSGPNGRLSPVQSGALVNADSVPDGEASSLR